jgi:hypothetical protein
MLQFIIRVLISAVLIAAAATLARRGAMMGAIIGSLPLVSILAVIWLWLDTGDPVRIADYIDATFWLVLASLPMFLIVPTMLRHGVGFWPSLGAGLALTVVSYGAVTWGLARFGGGQT